MTTPEACTNGDRAARRAAAWPVQLVHTAALQSAGKVLRLQPHARCYPVAGDHVRALAALLEVHPNATHNNTSRQGDRNDGGTSCALLLLADPLDSLLLHALVCSSDAFTGSTLQPAWGPYQREQRGWQLTPETLQDLRGMLNDRRGARRAALWLETAPRYGQLAGVLADLQALPGAPDVLPVELRPVRRMVAGTRRTLAAHLQRIEAPAWQEADTRGFPTSNNNPERYD